MAPLAACAAGVEPPNVALMQLLMEAADPAEAEVAICGALRRRESLADYTGAERLGAMLRLWRAHPDAWTLVRSVVSTIDHQALAASPQAAVTHWSSVFDRLARASPDAGVALYALGSAELLAAATAEIVERLEAWDLIRPDTALIDLGCGAGRLIEALAPRVRFIAGTDVSSGMMDEARRRCAGLANIDLVHSSGLDLAPFAEGAFELILAVDVFPYVVQSGMALAEAYMREAARVLRRGGNLVVMNFSYRGDIDRDRADVARLADEAGFDLVRHGTREFALWDGTAFQLAKRSRDMA